MKANPCPDDCTFDWKAFHDQLETAVAHMITDAKIDTPGKDYLPSQASILQLLNYSKAKVDMQAAKEQRQ